MGNGRNRKAGSAGRSNSIRVIRNPMTTSARGSCGHSAVSTKRCTQMRLAEKADPLSSVIQQRLAVTLISAGKYDEAAAKCGANPECLGQARLGQGKIDEAIQILSTVKNSRYLGYAYGRAGRREEAEKLAVAAAPNAFFQSLIYAGLGDKDRTLDALYRVTNSVPQG